ncbi:hypothetical protein F2Q69_00023494 [Brassica cretica]|uniref:Uncharacterized protein n=2 Tax=Brassica cretica TaxID=69181 RepID=A0A8S9QA22_BRACR|nr:hypothetical protein F2Q69_00023494 [Brassica cretica]
MHRRTKMYKYIPLFTSEVERGGGALRQSSILVGGGGESPEKTCDEQRTDRDLSRDGSEIISMMRVREEERLREERESISILFRPQKTKREERRLSAQGFTEMGQCWAQAKLVEICRVWASQKSLMGQQKQTSLG